jgi:hypothetical protein
LERYHQITKKIRYYRLYFHLLMSVKKGQQLSLAL